MSFGIDKEGLVVLNSSSTNLEVLNELGGLAGLASKLDTNLRKGLSSTQVNDKRKEKFVLFPC